MATFQINRVFKVFKIYLNNEKIKNKKIKNRKKKKMKMKWPLNTDNSSTIILEVDALIAIRKEIKIFVKFVFFH